MDFALSRRENSLSAWYALSKQSKWTALSELRADFPSADGVVVASGRVVTVFNLRGNNYRMITAIHYDSGKLFLLRFLRYHEYDKAKWKDQL